MKLTLEQSPDEAVTIVAPAVSASELVELFVRLGVAGGWAESSIVDAMGELVYLRDQANTPSVGD